MKWSASLIFILSLSVLLVSCSKAGAPRENRNDSDPNASHPTTSPATADIPATAEIPEIPEFPWRPPKASASTVIQRSLLVRSNAQASLNTVADRLRDAFYDAGYDQVSFYAVPDGFALVSRLEQFKDDGSPLEGSDRWAPQIPPLRKFSLTDYMKALLRGRPGHYRVIVFIVSPNAFTQTGNKVSREEAAAWGGGGINELPSDIGSRPYTRRHSCTALIYEFEQPNRDTTPVFRDPGSLTAVIHLRKSNILPYLER